MDKKYVVCIASIMGALGGIAIFAWQKMKRNEQAHIVNDPFLNAGKPGQIKGIAGDETQIENAKMVSEGSQFGVQYFNKSTLDMLEKMEERIDE